MKLDDFLTQCQTEACTALRSRTRFIDTVECLRNMLDSFFRHTSSVIENTYAVISLYALTDDHDITAVIDSFSCIIQKVRKYRTEKIRLNKAYTVFTAALKHDPAFCIDRLQMKRKIVYHLLHVCRDELDAFLLHHKKVKEL